MSLFTVPMTLNDGVGDRIFSFLRQEPDSKNIVAIYCEDAAALAAKSRIIVKHDDKKPTHRHLLQRQIYLTPAADPDEQPALVTLNFTVQASSDFTAAELSPEFALFLDALSEVGLFTNLLSGKV